MIVIRPPPACAQCWLKNDRGREVKQKKKINNRSKTNRRPTVEPHRDGFRTVFTVKSRYYVNSRPSSSRERSIEQIAAVILLSPHDRRRYRRLRADAIVKPVRPVDTFDSFGVSRSGPGANKNLRPGGTRCPHDHTTIRRRTTWYGSAPVGLYSPPFAHVV